jgi:FdhD protein
MSKEIEASVLRVRGVLTTAAQDWLAVERPLRILAGIGDDVQVVSTTMRTPGDDRALAAGFLFGERVIRDRRELETLETIDDDTVMVALGREAAAALEAARRPFVTTGACGVCGRTDLNALFEVADRRDREGPTVAAGVVHALPSALRAAQATFARTGGLHAAGLFTPSGAAVSVHEDVGRHNAVDKLVGTALLAGRLPADDHVLVVSGRASFELVQKAAVAGIAIMVAVGAPSSLAVEIARTARMTLIGFARDDRFNIYCGGDRIDETCDETRALEGPDTGVRHA